MLEALSEGGEWETPEGDAEIGHDRLTVAGGIVPATKDIKLADQVDADSVGIEDALATRSKTPASGHDALFKVPLTSMFRRSLSAPAPHTRTPCPDAVPSTANVPTHIRRDTISLPLTVGIVSQSPWPSPSSLRQHEVAVRSENVNDALDRAVPPRLPPLTFVDGGGRWNDVSLKTACIARRSHDADDPCRFSLSTVRTSRCLFPPCPQRQGSATTQQVLLRLPQPSRRFILSRFLEMPIPLPKTMGNDKINRVQISG
jgi:hypothetical protein